MSWFRFWYFPIGCRHHGFQSHIVIATHNFNANLAFSVFIFPFVRLDWLSYCERNEKWEAERKKKRAWSGRRWMFVVCTTRLCVCKSIFYRDVLLFDLVVRGRLSLILFWGRKEEGFKSNGHNAKRIIYWRHPEDFISDYCTIGRLKGRVFSRTKEPMKTSNRFFFLKAFFQTQLHKKDQPTRIG